MTSERSVYYGVPPQRELIYPSAQISEIFTTNKEAVQIWHNLILQYENREYLNYLNNLFLHVHLYNKPHPQHRSNGLHWGLIYAGVPQLRYHFNSGHGNKLFPLHYNSNSLVLQHQHCTRGVPRVLSISKDPSAVSMQIKK